ncbi:MAG: hypothetical protein WBZ33_00300, partial [Thermoactinomyces sp.]
GFSVSSALGKRLTSGTKHPAVRLVIKLGGIGDSSSLLDWRVVFLFPMGSTMDLASRERRPSGAACTGPG